MASLVAQFQVRRTFLELVEVNRAQTLRFRSQSLPTIKVSDWECQAINCCCRDDDCTTASTTSGPDFSVVETCDLSSSTDSSALQRSSTHYAAMPTVVMMPVRTPTVCGHASPPSQNGSSTAAVTPEYTSYEHAASDVSVRQGARRRRRYRGELKFAECLEELRHCDPRCVLRLSGMGRRADPEMVKKYFETRYGEAESLLLANSLESRTIMGFLVLRHSEQVALILADGLAHEVGPGASVQVRIFLPCEAAQS